MKALLQQKSAFGWLLTFTFLILLVPLTAMQFSNEVNWTLFDFIAMAILILSCGLALMFLARKLTTKQFVLSAIAVFIGFLYVWAELAVGLLFNFGA